MSKKKPVKQNKKTITPKAQIDTKIACSAQKSRTQRYSVSWSSTIKRCSHCGFPTIKVVNYVVIPVF